MELEQFQEINELEDNFDGYHIPKGNGYRIMPRSKFQYRKLWKFVPWIVALISFICCVLLLVTYLRNPPCENPTDDFKPFGDEVPPFTKGEFTNLTDSQNVTESRTITEAVTGATPNVTFSDLVQPTNPQNTTQTEEMSYRLPTDLVPTLYRIQIVPRFENNITTGVVRINFTCVAPTDKIVLNVKKLYIQDSIVVKVNDDTIEGMDPVVPISKAFQDEEREMMYIFLEDKLVPTKEYYLQIYFSGNIKLTANGLYRSSSRVNGTEKLMASTLLSPAEARSVFPCFDEPSFKAIFLLSIGRRVDQNCISNVGVEFTSIKDRDGYVIDYFKETPVMSTYLLGFVISNFESLTLPNTNIQTLITVYSAPEDISQMNYVLTLAYQIMEYLENYLDVPYPINKLDIVAVPDQEFNAMENFGLIIIRKSMAYVNNKTDEAHKQEIALMLAHELAHQWFGNLVTPKWWNDLWLKEGFSTYFGNKAINEITSGWNIPENFQFDGVDQAFRADALSTSTAISETITKVTPEIFNIITYNKGSSLIEMVSRFLGVDIFYKGVTSYLRDFSFHNADQYDLWHCFNEIASKHSDQVKIPSDLDVMKIMRSWTLQPGYPVVTVERFNISGRTHFTQERFLLNGKKDFKSKWIIPITYTTGIENDFENAEPKLWLTKRELYTEINTQHNTWILVNINQTGFYHVNYDIANWAKLIDKFDTFPNNTKAQLLSDSHYLAQASKIPYDIALSITFSLTKETNYLPWKVVTNHIIFIGNLMKNMPANGNYGIFIRTMVNKVFNELNMQSSWLQSDSDSTNQAHKSNIMHIACHFDVPNCLNVAYSLFSLAMSDTEGIPDYMRSVIYCYGIKSGKYSDWLSVYQTIIKTKNLEERKRLIYSLGCTKETWLLTRALSIILPITDVMLTPDESMAVFESVASNDLGNPIAINFIRDQWPYLLQKFENPSIIYKMVSNTVGFMNTPHSVNELKTLIDNIENKTEETSLLLHQTLEIAENNMMWMKNSYAVVNSFMDMIKEQFALEF